MRLGQLLTTIPIRVEHKADHGFLAAQELSRKTAAVINGAPFVGFGNIVEYTFAGAGASKLAHKLDRSVQGWIVTRVRGAAVSVYESASDENTLTLTSSGAGRVSVWVW